MSLLRTTHWRHYEVRRSGECIVLDRHDEKLVSYEMGTVETGRSRVFAGYFVHITLGDDKQITAEDAGSLVHALRRLASNISASGPRLNCVGLSTQWRESGLSENTGFGYFGPHQQPMHMMDEMPDDGGDGSLDRIVHEAVEGMRIGLV